ncbi:MAG: sulfatase [Planctomycetota bacterium]
MRALAPVPLAVAASLALLAGCTAPPAATAPDARRPPNFVLFLVDDLGWQDLSLALGPARTRQNDTFRTPNVERLAREGTRFAQAYAHCVCTPTRVGILTGAHPARTGVTNWTLRRDTATDAAPRPAGEDHAQGSAPLRPPTWNVNGLSPEPATPRAFCADTLPQRLQARGYATILVGKAHFGAIGTPGSDPRRLGFDVNVAGHAAGAPSSYLAANGFLRERGDQVWQVPGLEPYHGHDAFLTDVLTTEALREIDRALDADRPFYLHLAHYAVHTPLNRDERFVAAYEQQGLDGREAMYAAMVEGVDHSLGRLLDHLSARGVLDDTVIVFASDNGGLSAHARGGPPHVHNAPLRSGKGSAYEGGIRVPLVVRWPGVAAADAVCRTPVAAEDLFATLCAAGGADPRCPDGRDLGPLLRGEPAAARDLFWHYPNVWGAEGPGIAMHSTVRSGRWKLIWFWERSAAELYDLEQDLGETRDLAAARPEVTADLRRRLREFLRSSGAMLPTRADGAPAPLP